MNIVKCHGLRNYPRFVLPRISFWTTIQLVFILSCCNQSALSKLSCFVLLLNIRPCGVLIHSERELRTSKARPSSHLLNYEFYFNELTRFPFSSKTSHDQTWYLLPVSRFRTFHFNESPSTLLINSTSRSLPLNFTKSFLLLKDAFNELVSNSALAAKYLLLASFASLSAS